MSDKRKAPVVIDLEAPAKPARKKAVQKATPKMPAKTVELENPADAAPVPEVIHPIAAQGAAMQSATRFMARKPSLISRLFLWVIGLLLGAVISVAFWDFVTGLMTRNAYLGWFLTGLIGLALLCLLIFALRELMAFSRLRRVDGFKRRAAELASSDDLGEHNRFGQSLRKFYKGRQDMDWAVATFNEQSGDILDGQTLAMFTETTLMAPLDKSATAEIETAARQVATGTALVPLALADIIIALTVNIRMIRRIAEIYGGRTGGLGSWRLVRSVAVHLVATGAVAIGDDMLGSIAGGSIMGKLSRRFGEGVINGALTARVGVAATEVCRPMPYRALPRPSVTGMMKRALTGFFERQ